MYHASAYALVGLMIMLKLKSYGSCLVKSVLVQNASVCTGNYKKKIITFLYILYYDVTTFSKNMRRACFCHCNTKAL